MEVLTTSQTLQKFPYQNKTFNWGGREEEEGVSQVLNNTESYLHLILPQPFTLIMELQFLQALNITYQEENK